MGNGMTFDQAVLSLRDGRTTFDEFTRATKGRWQSLALYIMRRWQLPPAVEPQDVIQELLLGAWRAVWKYDASRGASPSRYVVWNAVDYAKKKAHKMRGANMHSPDNSPGRPELVFARFRAAADDPEYFANMMGTEPEQNERLEEADRVARAKDACADALERRVIDALARAGSVQAAVSEVYRDTTTRRAYAIRSEQQALELVAGAATRVALRLKETQEATS